MVTRFPYVPFTVTDTAPRGIDDVVALLPVVPVTLVVLLVEVLDVPLFVDVVDFVHVGEEKSVWKG